MHVTSQLARRRAAATSLRPATSRAPASPRASYSTAAARRLRHAAQPRNPALRRGHSGLITILCMHGRLSVHRHTLSERAAGSVSPGWLMRHAVLPPPPLPLGRPAGGARWGRLAGDRIAAHRCVCLDAERAAAGRGGAGASGVRLEQPACRALLRGRGPG